MINTLADLENLLAQYRNVFIGTDIVGINGPFERFKDEFIDVWLADGKNIEETSGYIVFLSHQGYVFSMVNSGKLNGPVITYMQGGDLVIDYDTIDDLIMAYSESG